MTPHASNRNVSGIASSSPAGLDPAIASHLRTGLDSLLQLFDELGRVLASERERLVARDWDAILRLAEDKDRLIQRLQAQSQEFDRTCAQAAPGTPRESLATVLEAAGLGPAHAALRERAAQLQCANRESRALLDHHHARVDTALRLLNRSDAPSSASLGLYGRDGYYARGAATAATGVQSPGGRIGGTGRRLAEA